MGTVVEENDDISILEATGRLENDTQPLLQDQSMCNNGGEEEDVLQNASYFALKKAFAALKVRLREVEHENERLHRQVKQLESSSGDFSGSGAPRPELMPSINKAYEAYKEKCHESSQLKEQLTKVTQKWQTAESQLQQLREQLSKGCTQCASQQTAGTAEGQTAQSCSKGHTQGTTQSCSKCDPHGIATSYSKCTGHETAPSCSKCAVQGQGTASSCPNGLEELTPNLTERFRKPTDPVPPMSDPGGSAPVSMATLLQEEIDQTRLEVIQLRSLVRTQHQALNLLLAEQAQSPESASNRREGPATLSDIGSLGALEGAEWASQPPSDSRNPPTDSAHPPDSTGGLVGAHGVHPVQCTDEFSRQNRQTNNNTRNSQDPPEDLMQFNTLSSRQTDQFSRTLNAVGGTGHIVGQTNQFGRTANTGNIMGPTNQFSRTANVVGGTGSIVGPRYPPADGYHCIVGIPIPTGRPDRQQSSALENRYRQLGANQAVQTPIRYQRNTEQHGSRHDNVGTNVNIAQPEPPNPLPPTTTQAQARQFAWLESGKDIPPQNIYTTQGTTDPTPSNNTHDLSPQVRGHDLPPQVSGHDLTTQVRGNDLTPQVRGHDIPPQGVGQGSGVWGSSEVGVRGSPLEWDRECPMCQQVFPDDIPQEMFVQHVNAHFEEEEARDDGFELFQM
ncbi:uncharacterized protein LOC144906006 [Branchiostoma floridae x Branchiostoma belcheri]